MKTKNLLLSALFFLTGIVSTKAQSPFQNVFFNLDSNQAPPDWNFVVELGNAALTNGRMEAYTVDAGAALEKTGTMPPNIDSLVFEWDGSVNYAFWGQGTAVVLHINEKSYAIWHGFDDYNNSSSNNVVRYSIYNSQSGSVAVPFSQTHPVSFGSFHHILQITNHKFHFRAINIATGQDYFNYSSSILDSNFNISNIKKVRFRLNCTTENNIWQDNLKMELFNSVNCANNLSISTANLSQNSGSSATLNATTSDPNPSFIWQSDLGLGFQNLSNYGQYSGVNSDSLVVANLQLRNHQQAFRVISTSGNCVDTSAVALLSLSDTCVQTMYDTNLVTVTDTLVILVTGIGNPAQANSLKAYPNPTAGMLYINTGNFAAMNGYSVRINNSSGQLIFEGPINQAMMQIPLADFGSTGLYYLRVNNPAGVVITTRKIVLQ
jgi:hypothetical protein